MRYRRRECGSRCRSPLALGQPLVFREWHPHARLARGLWKIPYPADGAPVTPDIVIAPLVGFDGGCYRLGYGGGFFDRTLAALSPKALAIGVGYPSAALRTIYPQPHDVPMDWIVTGSLPSVRRAAATCAEKDEPARPHGVLALIAVCAGDRVCRGPRRRRLPKRACRAR